MTNEEKAELRAKVRKSKEKKETSLAIQILESDWYDYNAGRRYLLTIIEHGQRRSETAWLPDGLPPAYKADKCIGWCDMSQSRLAARRGCSEEQVQKDIKQMRKDGVVQARGWEDENHIPHLMYRVVPEMIAARKRPSQDANDPSRPGRYGEPNPNRGHFSKKNQPLKAMVAAAGENEDDA